MYITCKRRVHRGIYLPEKMERSIFSATAHPGRHNPFGACKKGMSAKLESHQTNAIHVIALVGFD